MFEKTPYENPNNLSLPDTDLTGEDEKFLLRQRLENLREAIKISIDEIIELKELEAILREDEEMRDAMPAGLGIPKITDRFTAALEAKRIERKSEYEYDAGDIQEGQFSLDTGCIEMIKQNWLNPKSLGLISTRNGEQSRMNFFDIFEKRDLSGIYRRCRALAVSPIYENMRKRENDHYLLKHGIEMKFTEKTARFFIPFKEFSDISVNFKAFPDRFVEISFVLPEHARVRNYRFRKGGTVSEFVRYVEKLDGEFSEAQIKYLETLVRQGVLRFYREVWELEDRDRIRSYFVNIRRDYRNLKKNDLRQKIMEHIENNNNILRRVDPKFGLFPEW